MDSTYKEKYLAEAREIVLRYVDQSKYAVFLFGSWAIDKGRKDSDLDIGIWGKNPLPDPVKSKISTDLEESIVPWPVDLVDFNRTGLDFNKIALKNIRYWNNPFGKDIRPNLLSTEIIDGAE